MKMHWGSTNSMGMLDNIFYVPQTQFAASKEILLSKLNLSEWTDVVKKGIIQYGKLYLFFYLIAKSYSRITSE